MSKSALTTISLTRPPPPPSPPSPPLPHRLLSLFSSLLPLWSYLLLMYSLSHLNHPLSYIMNPKIQVDIEVCKRWEIEKRFGFIACLLGFVECSTLWFILLFANIDYEYQFEPFDSQKFNSRILLHLLLTFSLLSTSLLTHYQFILAQTGYQLIFGLLAFFQLVSVWWKGNGVIGTTLVMGSLVGLVALFLRVLTGREGQRWDRKRNRKRKRE